MTKDIEKAFFDRFDFVYTSGDPRDDLMVFGFECDDGWKDILWELCEKIEIELRTTPHDSSNPFRFLQVKQKYGTLRVYASWETDRISDLIQEAERKSCTTCEVCGDAGVRSGDFWVKTLCAKHHEEDESASSNQ